MVIYKCKRCKRKYEKVEITIQEDGMTFILVTCPACNGEFEEIIVDPYWWEEKENL